MPGDHDDDAGHHTSDRRSIDIEHYCVHFYNDHLDIHRIDHDEHDDHEHRPLDHDEYAAFICALIERAIHDDPALVLNCVEDDHDFLRALDNRRRSNHIEPTQAGVAADEMTLGDGIVAVSVIVAVIILRWHRYRYRKWSIHLSINSAREKDEGPTRKGGP